MTAADLEAFLDGLMPAQLEREDVAGAVVAVVKDGQVLFAKGYGYSDMAKRTPVTPDATLFRPRLHLEALYLDLGDATGRAGQARSEPGR